MPTSADGLPSWIDTHCHLDAAEFDPDRSAVVARARAAGVGLMVLPAVTAAQFESLRTLAHATGAAYALGIHPLYVEQAADDDLDRLSEALLRWRTDPHLVAVGEIGIDHFVPGLDRARQEHFYRVQLKLAQAAGLPVIVHIRRSADALLAGLRRTDVEGGIVHAFNASDAQTLEFTRRGFRLGFGGALTFPRALQIRHLASSVDAGVPVLETDAPDIPPQWLYRGAAARALGAPQGRNEPAELPRIAAELAAVRGWTLAETAERTRANALAALPGLQRLWPAVR